MYKLLAISWIFYVSSSFGQTFENIRSQRDEDKIIIVYDLVSNEPGSNVIVRVFSSLDDYGNPLTNVTGDIGTVLPGPNKRIIWQVDPSIAKEYLSILFKFESETFAGWRIVSPTAKGMRRGKSNNIQWQGGSTGDDITIQLLKPDAEAIAQMKNTGSFDWNTPKILKPGSGYVIRITSNNNSMEHRFSIKRKIPLGYYGIPVAGLAIYLVSTIGNSGSNDLPDAPLPN